MTASDHLQPRQFEVREYEGITGREDHITRGENGMIPVSWVANMRGVKGEVPGEHRNHQGARWDEFKRKFAEPNDGSGIHGPIFITVDHGQEPRLSEGSHRRDAAVELGHTHINAEVRYFGNAQHEGTLQERAER